MTEQNIYHERQSRQLCCLHALNNLFQAKQTYTKEELDDICTDLSPESWLNPHRSWIGWGNYDVNVLMRALSKRNCEAAWFDKRKDPACINLDVVFGFILNVPSDYKIGFVTLPLHRRHWIAVRKINDNYYNLDSKLSRPECIGNEVELLRFLRSQLNTNEREVFVILTNENVKENWLRDEEVAES
ncbi:josephin-like protein [Teleopsis dalmanni]|uniref:josephin-like protein n=1 Tax=Teleopsis dalmanni TaxID=139649 RepID=UPI0018CE555D|nr:josephin-like protein [Teleopsis dalmanni]